MYGISEIDLEVLKVATLFDTKEFVTAADFFSHQQLRYYSKFDIQESLKKLTKRKLIKSDISHLMGKPFVLTSIDVTDEGYRILDL